jgi:hypothetical protein
MTIAASINISPSLRLRYALMVMTLIASVCCALFVRELPLIAGLLFGLTYIAITLVAWFKLLRASAQVRLDIANNGRMILRTSLGQGRWSEGMLVRFDRRSVLWEYYVSLRLIDDAGKALLLPILPDSVAEGDFRRLLVALKWIAMRSVSDDSSNEDVNPRNF